MGCEDTDLSRDDQADTNDAVVRDDTGPTVGDRLENAAERTGEGIKTAADRTGEAIKDGADAVADATGDAMDSAQTAADKTGDAMKDAVDADAAADPDVDAADVDANVTADADGTLAPDGTAAAPDAEGIRDLMASSTEASLTKGGLNDLVERFVDADRNRIGDAAEQDMPELDAIIASIQEQWQAKYDQEFDISNEELVFNESFRINQGELGNEARLAADANVNVDADGADANVDVQNNTGVDAPTDPAADRNLNDPGRNVATVTVPESQDLPELTLNLIHELPDNWRIDIPDEVTADKLQQNLKEHLTHVKDNAAMWPGDVNEAYRLVSHHVFMALMDEPVNASAASGGGM
jgi:hypothetical protein